MKKFKEFCSEHKKEIILAGACSFITFYGLYKGANSIYKQGQEYAYGRIESVLIDMDRTDLLEDLIKTIDKCIENYRKGAK